MHTQIMEGGTVWRGGSGRLHGGSERGVVVQTGIPHWDSDGGHQ